MESHSKIIEVISNIGYYLLNFVDGVDASNFIQVLESSGQFCSLATVSDYVFLEIVKKFNCNSPIMIPQEAYESYLHECDLVNFRLISLEKHDLLLKQPEQRLFVHPCFGIEAFNKLSKTYRTPLFQCYSRLISFNTDFYCSEYGLINYDLYAQTIGSNRSLNVHEKKLFKSK